MFSLKRTTFLQIASVSTFLVSGLLSGVSHAWANQYNLQGPYAGVTGGLNTSSLRQTGIFTTTGLSDDLTTTSNNSVSNNHYYLYPFLGAQVGYRSAPINDRYSVAIEVFGQLDNGQASERFQSTTTSVSEGEVLGSAIFKSTFKTQLESIYGIRVLPGILVWDNALIYGILGIGVAHFKSQVDSSFQFSSVEIDTQDSASISGTHSVTKTSPQIGVGAEFAINNHVGVGASYIYSYYGNINTSASGIREIEELDTFRFNASSKQRVSNHEVGLHVNYYV